MLERIGFDWSEQPSGKTLDDVSPVALEVARRYQRESNGTRASLTEATDTDLLRRLNLVKGERGLTNAAALLFVATPWPGVDYIRPGQACCSGRLRRKPTKPSADSQTPASTMLVPPP